MYIRLARLFKLVLEKRVFSIRPIEREETVGKNPYCHISYVVYHDREESKEYHSCMMRELMSCYCYCWMSSSLVLTDHECVDWARLLLLLMRRRMLTTMMMMRTRAEESVVDDRADRYESRLELLRDVAMPTLYQVNLREGMERYTPTERSKRNKLLLSGRERFILYRSKHRERQGSLRTFLEHHLRFWNQILTWVAERLMALARCSRSGANRRQNKSIRSRNFLSLSFVRLLTR